MANENLTVATVHGLKWSYLSTVTIMLLQIGVTAILARLLTPSEFGLVAMAALFLRFGQYFSQMGVGQAVVQKQDLTPQDVRTAFTLSLLVGAGFCVLFFALAPVAALLFPDTPGVADVVRVMSLTFLLSGLTSTTQGLLQRRFAFKAMGLAEIFSFVAGYALVGLALALWGLGAWSLVFASLGQVALIALTFAAFCRHDLAFGLSRNSIRSIYSFGWRVSLIGFAEFIAANLDTLWTGHYLGSRATGLYTKATNIATVPLSLLNVGLSRVLLPGLSRIQLMKERLKAVYLATLTVVGGLAIPAAWGLAGASHEAMKVLLGSQWLAAAPVLTILAIAAPFALLTHFGAIICEATATLNAKIAITMGSIAVLVPLLLILDRFGIIGVATAFAASVLATNAAYLLVLAKLLGIRLSELWECHTVGLAAGAVAGLLCLGAHELLGRLGWPSFVILLAQVAIGTGCLLLAARSRKGFVWTEIRKRLIEAGYSESGGATGRFIRLMDALT